MALLYTCSAIFLLYMYGSKVEGLFGRISNVISNAVFSFVVQRTERFIGDCLCVCCRCVFCFVFRDPLECFARNAHDRAWNLPAHVIINHGHACITHCIGCACSHVSTGFCTTTGRFDLLTRVVRAVRPALCACI